MTIDRYEDGVKTLKEIYGEASEKIIATLQASDPDLARYVIEAYGYPFKSIDLKSREIAVVAALTTLGNAAAQLKVHIYGALNVGCSREEVVDVIMLMAGYAGFPSALNGMTVAKEVFAERDEYSLS